MTKPDVLRQSQPQNAFMPWMSLSPRFRLLEDCLRLDYHPTVRLSNLSKQLAGIRLAATGDRLGGKPRGAAGPSPALASKPEGGERGDPISTPSLPLWSSEALRPMMRLSQHLCRMWSRRDGLPVAKFRTKQPSCLEWRTSCGSLSRSLMW